MAGGTDFSISTLGSGELDAVETLRKENNRTLGFMAFEVLREFLNRGGVLGAKTNEGVLIGYLLYASYHARIRVVHLCVSEHHRGSGIAARLFDELRQRSTTQLTIKLSCRRDFPAHTLWPKLGFVPVDETPGRSLAGHLLTRWEYQLAESKQLDLFREKASNEAVDVVIDAQIFFHFHEPSSAESDPSKGLLADFLSDSLDLCMTEEIFVEIDRIKDSVRRADRRRRAYEFRILRHSQALSEHYESLLREILPARKASQVSDIRHLAKAAASEATVFATRDDALLKRAKAIEERTGLTVLSPTEVIIQLHKLVDAQEYGISNISGTDLGWRRLVSNELPALLAGFSEPDERRGALRERIERLLVRPDVHKSEVLCHTTDIRAVRISEIEGDRLIMHFARVARGPDRALFARFLVADSIASAIDLSLASVRFDKALLGRELASHLLDTGFVELDGAFVRLCICESLNRQDVLAAAEERFEGLVDRYAGMTPNELSEACAPLHLLDADDRYFIVPIKPGYAMSLFDKVGAGADLFGWKSEVLMRWENVYYRRKTHHKILQIPARVLWYESHPRSAITAVSRLDAVEVGSPKVLFRKFKRYGTLDWDDLYEMCNKDARNEIMALKFSQTFALRRPVQLQTLRELEGRQEVPLQSPRKIGRDLFGRILDAGYGGKKAQ